MVYSPETDADVMRLPALIEIVEPIQPHHGWMLLDTAYNLEAHALRSGIARMPGHDRSPSGDGRAGGRHSEPHSLLGE